MSLLRNSGYLAAALFLAAIAFAIGMRWPHAPTQPAASEAQKPAAESPGVVIVPAEAQQQSGLETAVPKSTVMHPTATAYATALDARPLLTARRQTATALAQLHAAEAAERASRAEFERSRKLFEDDRNISLKAMQAAEAAWHADQGKLEAATAALRETQAATVQQFGAAFAGTAEASPPDAGRLASGHESLVQVMLPAFEPAAAPTRITLSSPGYATSGAQLIGPSPQVAASASGRAFLYRSRAAYPAGLRLQADLPLAAKPVAGFVVPESAVVWYGNEAWVYVQSGEDRFVRTALGDPQPVAEGIFTTTPLAADRPIVTRGAQLLQSESLRPRTPATSGCADPECDD
jgi:membrane fusion protein, multidrug efflux system